MDPIVITMDYYGYHSDYYALQRISMIPTVITVDCYDFHRNRYGIHSNPKEPLCFLL